MFSFGFTMPEKMKAGYAPQKPGFAIVELFTSEGCSSCPPADEALAALAKDYPANVYVLGFHVDYWNYLGWKDEFSTASYTNRQQQYAGVFNLSSIYTPQVIVNGKTQFTGSDKSRLYSTVAKELNAGNAATIELAVQAGSANDVKINYKFEAGNNTVLCIALLQLEASSVVKRGENKGLVLHHINVVRDFKTMPGNNGSTRISLPAGLSAKDFAILAFVQDKNDMHILAVAEAAVK